jgi:DNA-directed RNA polymerase subunit alpha
MTDITEFWIKKEEVSDGYGRFVISPLAGGFGYTVGNSLRRVLLGAMPGSAVTKIKIDGVSHAFATIKGVKEDVLDIITSIKQIRFISKSNDPVKGKIDKTGPGLVTAGDISFPAGVKVVNKDLVLANLTDKTKFKAELTVEKGQGYSLADDHKVDKMKIISVDAIFSPVVKANFTVSPVRSGKTSSLDEVVFEIWTDRTVDPEVLIGQAAEILVSVFSQIVKPSNSKPKKKIVEKKNSELEVVVDELDIPLRLANALKKAGFKKVSDFQGVSRKKITKAKNVGEKSVTELEKVLNSKGVFLEE